MSLLYTIEVDDVNYEYLNIQFTDTVKVSTIVDDNFSLLLNSATPVLGAFRAIDIANDYNSISRILTLYFAEALYADSSYGVQISNLKNAANSTMDSEIVEFTTGELVPELEEPEPETVQVIDHSVKIDLFTNDAILNLVPATDLYVVSTDPDDGTFYLEPDYNNGRMIIKFSLSPAANYVNTTYFRAQQRVIQRGPTRWENVDAVVTLDSQKPWVYVDFPSIDFYPEQATPSTDVVYYSDGYEYFDTNYKYRVVVSKNVTT